MKHKILIFILIITQLYSADKKDLSIKQHGVVNQLDELENKMIRLIDSLKNTEPELAQRLTNALKALKDKRLSPRFAEIATHLKENDLDSAIKDQTQATRDLLQMLEILQEENEYDKLRKEIERLKNLSKKVAAISKDEHAQKREADRTENSQDEASNLDKKISELEILINDQKKQITLTAVAIKAGKQNLSDLQNTQTDLTKRTVAIHQSLINPGKNPDEPNQAPEPGEKPMAEAAANQKDAGMNLNGNKPNSAREKQNKALQKMEEALAELKKEKARLQQELEKQHAEMKDKQDATKEELAKASKPPEDGSENPGQQEMKEAEESMSDASQSHSKQQGKSASEQKQKAKEKLDQAKEKIDEKIQELQEELKEALIDELIAHLERALELQKLANSSTGSLAKKLETEDKNKHLSQFEKILKLESDALSRVIKSDKMLKEDGSSIVFASILQSDVLIPLQEIIKQLESHEINETLQLKQLNVEETLKELLAALESNQPENEENEQQEQQQQQQQQQQDQPLLNPLQELKLLRLQQFRVNRQTKRIRESNIESKSTELKKLAAKQKDIFDLMNKLLEANQ